jgi:hypothetical protein
MSIFYFREQKPPTLKRLIRAGEENVFLKG